jgi:hypothetical protein
MEKLSDKEWLALRRYNTAPLSEIWRDAIDIVLVQRRAEREGVMATGDSWAWIRAKFERSGDKYRWYKPRTDELVGTRYEVMGWLHCLFADTDPTVFIDITLEHQKRTDEAEAENDALKAQIERLEDSRFALAVAHTEDVLTIERLKAPVSDEELQPLHDKYGYFKYGDAQGDVSRKFVNDLLSARAAAPVINAVQMKETK